MVHFPRWVRAASSGAFEKLRPDVLQPAPEERPQPPLLGHPRRTTHRDRDLDLRPVSA